MRLRRPAVLALLVVAAIASAGGFAQEQSTVQSPQVAFHQDVDPAIDALWASYDRTAAMEHVRFISQYWRLAGNPGYNATVDRIQARLKSAGIATSVEEYPTGPAWDHSAASLAIVRPGAPDEVVLSRDKDRLTLCINSFSTPEGGTTGRLVDVGKGTEQDFAGKELKGAIVLGDTDAGALFRRAVVTGGAAGVVSTTLPGYLNVDVPGAARATPRHEWDILQWGSVPNDEARKSFGFKASPRAAATLRQRLADAGPNTAVMVKVNIAASFSTGPARTLVAEIPGSLAPAERIVLAAHIQEPGANDNASGVATLAEMAVAMSTAIKQKKIAGPLRTITFLFLNEISGSRRWIQDHPAEAKQVKYMFSLDMTGEDVSKTGGTFLVERHPDPGAVWERPWDPHSEWGKGNVRAESLKGDLLNDVHLTVLRRVAAKSKWVVSTNPYEGGSDHTVFGTAGVPSVLDWHFTDRYYHTNFDTPDKTSPDEMRNVGVGAGATAWLLASADAGTASRIASIVAFEGERRVQLEQTAGAKLAAESPDRAAAETREATIVAAWKKWYREAVQSATRLVIGPVPAEFEKTLALLSKPFVAAPGAPAVAQPFAPGLPAEALAEAGGPFISDAEPGSPEPPQNPTPIFTCGTDQVLPDAIPVRWSTVVLAGDGRLYSPCPFDPRTGENRDHLRHREAREAMVIDVAAGNLSIGQPAGGAVQRADQPVEVVQRGVQAVARLRRPVGGLVVATLRPDFAPACSAEARVVSNQRWQPGLLFIQMRNANALVRKEAAYGIVVKLSETDDEQLLKFALIELRACLDRETSPDIQAVLLEGWGVAKYTKDEQRAEAEAILVDESRRGLPTKILGATKALEALIRLAPRRPVSDTARLRLRELALYGKRLPSPDVQNVDARIRRLAMMALQAARDTDSATLLAASDDGDWQVRRLVAARLNLADPQQAVIVAQYVDEPAFQVRYELIGAIGRLASATKLCAPLVARFKDPSPIVAMRAMDAVLASCSDLDDVAKPLVEFVRRLEKPSDTETWHLPARALTTLARLKPEEAQPRLAAAAKSPTWQVRVSAATAAGVLADEDVAVKLSRDEVANVQTAALEALQRMKSPAVVPQAILVLQNGKDHQLLRTAALVLRGLPAELKEDASAALLGALTRLTEEESDTSRDPRVAILERLGETLAPQRSTDLLPHVADFDDEVIAAASKAFQQVVGGPPAEVKKRRRYPLQPNEEALSALPSEAIIELEEGTVTIDLLREVAPVTIARFAALVIEGAYNNRTFHRVVPNFVVQGGSPGANEYAGTTPRFMRDEVGPQASHIRGAVGISTRGRDTGDGQIFIDLVDVPRLDRDYTVFGYVRSGMELVDRLLEGAVIKRITVR